MIVLQLPLAILGLIGLYFLHQYLMKRFYGIEEKMAVLPISRPEIDQYIKDNDSREIPDVDINQPFPWDRRTSLVIYSKVLPQAHPDKKYPSLVLHDVDSGGQSSRDSGIIADGVPCLIETDYNDMLHMFIKRWKEQACDQDDLNKALIAEKWVEQQDSDYYFFELEPPECAGNAFHWAKHAEKKL